jgi:hypothetical protein
MTLASALVNTDTIVRPIGSGEGMIECYQRARKKADDEDEGDDRTVTSVLFSIEEVDSLGAMGGRSGSTTMSILRQGFSGETLGFSYRGRAHEQVAAHTYRMTVVAAVQPERAGALLDDAGGGTPQRFMWFPGRDKRITAYPPAFPSYADGSPKVLPILSAADMARHTGYVQIPDEVAHTIRQARAASMSGDDNALDGHALFCREKFAFALAFMAGRTDITIEDWRLAGIAADVSDWTRQKAQSGYLAGKERDARARGRDRGIENDERTIAEQDSLDRHVRRIIAWIHRTLSAHGPMTAGELRKRAAGRDRPRVGTAVTAATETGLLGIDEDGRLVVLIP